MNVDLIVEEPGWSSIPLEELADRSANAVARNRGLDTDACSVSVLACDDARISGLNAEFRDKPRPTNVLSWPSEDLSPDKPGGEPHLPEPDFTGEIELGDIAIAWETCAREAAEAGRTVEDHVTHLLVHGLLHLLGYDHIDDADAAVMEALEVNILSGLGIDNPYILSDRA